MISRKRLRRLATAGALIGIAAGTAHADPLRLYGVNLLFDVYRNGVSVGSHAVSFDELPTGYRVESDFSISVKFWTLEVYRFRYRSEELWRQNKLNRIVASVDDNGDRFRFEAIREGDSMHIDLPEERATVPAPIYPTTHWNSAVLIENRVLNTLTGRLNAVEIIRIADEQVTTEMGDVPATRYAYTGELKTEVWYDTEGRWVKMRFEGTDGSTIEYVCRRCQGASARSAT